MKVLACLLALVCVASAVLETPAIVNKIAARENLSQMNAAKAKCTQDVGTTDKGLYSLCFSKVMGWQNADGTINRTFIDKRVRSIVGDHPNVKPILEECVVEKATPQETAIHIIDCTKKYGHKPEEILAD